MMGDGYSSADSTSEIIGVKPWTLAESMNQPENVS